MLQSQKSELNLEMQFDCLTNEIDHFDKLTSLLECEIVRDLIAHQIVGHNNFDEFSDSEWYEFLLRYRVFIAKTLYERSVLNENYH